VNAPFKIKVLPRSAVKVKVDARFPANVIGATPIHVNRTNQNYTISLDVAELIELVSGGGRITDKVVQLQDIPSIPLDSSLGTQFKLLATGNRSIQVPSNVPPTGRSQKIIIIHEASAATRTLSLTGGPGGFRFGTDLTALTPTPAGLADYIGAIWNERDNCWDVVSFARGF